MKKNIPNKDEYIMQDEQGNTVPPFEVDKKKAKKNLVKTSTGYTVFAVLLYILTFLPIAGVTCVLAIKTSQLMPYYSFWPFVGVIVVGVFALLFYLVLLIVARKSTKKSIMTQTAILAIVYSLLTTVFSLAITYAFPDAIAVATQNTIYGEDVLYNGEKMVEGNAQLEREYVMYNLLNGNLGGEYSYHDLSSHNKSDQGAILGFNNAEIKTSIEGYMYSDPKTKDGKSGSAASNTIIQNNIARLDTIIETLEDTNPRKYEMFKFVYEQYVLNDSDFAFMITAKNKDARMRKALALSIVDYEYNHSRYEEIIARGFTNNATDPDPELNAIFNRNYNSFNHDGYIPFDDEHLLLAQINGRMTIPVVIHLILDDIYQYSQPSWDNDGNIMYEEDGNFLYTLYMPDERDAYESAGGLYDHQDEDGTKFGYNAKGWKIYEDGTVHRPMKWVVLDMLGEGMSLATLDIPNVTIAGILPVNNLFVPAVTDTVSALLNDDLPKVIDAATHGAELGIGLRLNDQAQLEINILSNNVKYGMLGYMQATWVGSNNLLMAVYNVVSVRNWFALFGALGVVLVIAAGVLRDCGKKIRERGAISVDRLNRMTVAEEEGIGVEGSEADLTAPEAEGAK
ncbi:MAG: hypothetical protein J5815_01715 [Clostridia bacterium]|nr:hypothetical protein [Clostridia bacterium]